MKYDNIRENGIIISIVSYLFTSNPLTNESRDQPNLGMRNFRIADC
jgi:hypothetical protein